jgi:hypothetical protein
MKDEDYVTSLEGPVEVLDGQFVLRIPLEAGGSHLAESARGISEVCEDVLLVRIPRWLAEMLGISEGTQVAIDNRNGKFTITPIRP